ncbi:MAG TPA: type II CAAX endopeptidase family protein [Kineosporiaceae bacterium]|nr:type II CAAX endopeptidase family protein [Kineosporiaceae bacterium]
MSTRTDRIETSTQQNAASRTGPVRHLIRRTPLPSFLVLSCLLSWWPGALQVAGVPMPGPAVTGVGPFLAAVIVLGLTQGRAGIRGLLRSMVQWRVPGRAYLAGIGLPLLVSGSAILATLALGAARPEEADVALWPTIPIMMLLVLLIPGIGGAWEEPGWRGFALRRLEDRFGLLSGSLVLGVFWVFWHAPLFWTGDILWTDVPVVVAASIVTAAVFHAGRDSVLIAMVLHATNNAVGGGYASELFHGNDQTTLGLLTAAGWWLIAGGILIRTWRQRTRNQPTHADPPTAGPSLRSHDVPGTA